MKKLSDSDLQNLLQQKLLNYEAEVPQDTNDTVLAQLGRTTKVSPTRSFVKYSLLAALIIFSSIIYFRETESQQDEVVATRNSPAIEKPGGIDKIKKQKNETVPEKTTYAGKVSGPMAKRKNNTNTADRASEKTSQREVTKRGITVKDERPVSQITTEHETIVAVIGVTKINQHGTDEEVVKIDSTEVALSVDVPCEGNENKQRKRLRFLNIGATPFLSYRRIQPNQQDGVELDEFSTPSAISSQRLGLKLSASAEYEITPNRFLAVGLAYTHYRNTFTYKSNEIIRNVDLFNTIDERVSALGAFAAIRYPVRPHARRKQYISLGLDGQALISKHNPETGRGLYSINLGYINNLPFNNGVLRVTPTVNYSMTRFHYGGVQAQTFWFGVEVGWLMDLHK